MPTTDRRRPDPLDPDADLDGFTSDELEDSLFGPDPARPRRARSRAARPNPHTGTRTGPSTKYCHACAERLDARAEICPHCGVRQPGVGLAYTTPSGRSRIVAALLAFLVGVFGVHKFYLGRPVAGVVFLLFFWTAIPALLGLIDSVLLLTMTDERFAERYG